MKYSAIQMQRLLRHGGLCLVVGAAALASLRANPAGGSVMAGLAGIGGQGTSKVTITQSSAMAIIDWNSFSIAGGEVTKFVAPGSTSATLNRVMGGEMSTINGTLRANDQVYLINSNGILIGPNGMIATAGFTASTRDISDSDFLSGNLHFTGSGDAGVENLGTIKAMGGNVYLIGKTVDNGGTIRAASGTVGLVAADDVLVTQQGTPGSMVTVQPSASATSAAGKTAVSNSGLIAAASAELKAANGNLYALAINNSGAIRATTLQREGGHIFLTADAGTIVNSGTLDASARGNGGQGGSVTLQNSGGTTVESGKILAKGGQGGAGGNAEVSGQTVHYSGTVDLSAPGGTTGTLLFDPENVIIQTAGPNTASMSGSPTDTFTGNTDDSIVTVSDLENALASANVVVVTGTTGSQAGDITVANAVSWSSANSLTLSAYRNVDVDAGLTSSGGAPVVLRADNTGTGTGTVNFANGATVSTTGATSIYYNPADNPAGSVVNATSYVAPTNYSADVSGSVTAYMLVNTVYDLQNMENNLTGDYALGDNINASATSGWNSGAGFNPIGAYDGSSSDASTFSGMLDGQNHVISGIYINRPGTIYAGLFGDTAQSAVVDNVSLTGVQVTGDEYVGGLVGVANGTFTNDNSSGTVTGTTYVGGLMGITYATLNRDSSGGTVDGTASSSDVGGLVGYQQGGSITNAYSRANVNTGANSSGVGGLVGLNGSTIMNTYAADTITVGSGTADVGGLVGANLSSVSNSFYDTDTAGGDVTTGVGNEGGSTPGVTPATTSELQSESFIIANAPAQPTFDFTSIWAIDSSINGGLPYLRNSIVPAGSGSTGSGGSGTVTTPATTAAETLTVKELVAQNIADQSDFARLFSRPITRLIERGYVVGSYTGEGINDGEGTITGLADLGRGSFQGEMVTPSNGYFGIVPGAVVTTPLPPGIFHRFEHVFDDGSLDVLGQAATSGR